MGSLQIKNTLIKQFLKNYEDLHTAGKNDSTKLDQFFNGLEVPILGRQEKAALDSSISTVEINRAIKKMKSGKAPGPEGFPIEFFKKFSSKLSPLFKNTMNTMTQATIPVLLKKEKYPLKCDSYRLVSLLCCDYTVLTKVLAGRFKSAMGTVIHPDQTSLILG